MSLVSLLFIALILNIFEIPTVELLFLFSWHICKLLSAQPKLITWLVVIMKFRLDESTRRELKVAVYVYSLACNNNHHFVADW